MNVNGGEFDDAHWTDYIFHSVTFPWKVWFAVLVPPPKYMGGWLTFFVSLAMIGLLTAIVGDLAAIFGCLLGLALIFVSFQPFRNLPTGANNLDCLIALEWSSKQLL